MALWVVAIAFSALAMLTWPINDDEVFYLARSWAVAHGEPSNGDLPLRYLLFLPYVWADLSPSVTISVSRLSMVLAAFLCGLVAWWTVKRLDRAGTMAGVAGAFTVIAMMGLPMVTLRPEYFACLFGLVGVALFVAPPSAMRRELAVFLAGACMGLAVGLSVRQIWVVPAALLAALIEPDRGARGRILVWTVAGLAAAGIPSVVYLLSRDSIETVRYWNTVFPIQAGWSFTTSLIVKVYLVACPAAGLLLAWRGDPARIDVRMIAMFWICAGVAHATMPLRQNYAQGMWLAMGIILCAAGPYRAARKKADASKRARAPSSAGNAARLRQQNAWLTVFVVMLVTPLPIPSLRPWIPTTHPRADFRDLASELRLIDWLGETSRGGPVICVTPYHPIRASNAWRMWNAWWYCFIGNRELNQTLNAGIADKLVSGEATVIEWNTWTGHTPQTRNLLRHALNTRVLPPEQAPDVARRLMERYRLVEWKDALPAAFGGGAFLVRRDIDVDARVAVQPDSVVLYSIYQR